MAIRIKQKLVAGVIFQFLLILLVGGFGIFYLMQLKNETRKIITNHYVEILSSLLKELHEIGKSLIKELKRGLKLKIGAKEIRKKA